MSIERVVNRPIVWYRCDVFSKQPRLWLYCEYLYFILFYLVFKLEKILFESPRQNGMDSSAETIE